MHSLEIPITELLTNFRQLSPESKKQKANQFAYDLIEISQQKMVAPKNIQLSKQQLLDFLHMVFEMISQETLLINQINALQSALNAQDLPLQYFDPKFITPFYENYFWRKQAKIYSEESNPSALFYKKQGVLCTNNLLFGSEIQLSNNQCAWVMFNLKMAH